MEPAYKGSSLTAANWELPSKLIGLELHGLWTNCNPSFDNLFTGFFWRPLAGSQ